MIQPGLRASLRSAPRMGVRYNSSSSASNPQVQRAMEGAQKAYQQSAATVQRFAGPAGERLGSMLGGWREPITYNFKVFTSLCRQVYQAEKMAFPTDLNAWASSYSQIWARAKSVSFWRDALSTGQWAGLAIVGVEAYGIFTIGEMIGRRHIVGYKLH